jgi:hypothetical protein
MSIHFILTWEEYFMAREFFRRNRTTLAPEYLWGGLLLLAGVVLWLMGEGRIVAVAAFVAGLALMFGSPHLRRWASRRKWFREPLYHTKHTVTASDEGVYFRMGRIESNLVWPYYQRLVESPDGFLLIYGGDSFNYLPKRAFAGADAIAQFRALASKNLSA